MEKAAFRSLIPGQQHNSHRIFNVMGLHRSVFSRMTGSLIVEESCLLCGSASGSDMPLCPGCMELILDAAAHVPAGRCRLCGRPLVSARDLCTTCREIPLIQYADRIHTVFSYTSVWQELLTVWKIDEMRVLSVFFAECFRLALHSQAIEYTSDVPVIIPVPPRPGKLRRRGWDQMHDIAGILSGVSGLTVLNCLERTSAIQQKGLGRGERAGNLRGQIRVRKGIAAPSHAVVIDDLMTTGSTIDSCAQALKTAGTVMVQGLALFFD